MEKVYIVGIGAEGAASLSAGTLELVRQAEVLVGGERLLAMFPDVHAQKVAIREDLAAAAKSIREQTGNKKVVVLASGDPGFFGIGRYLVRQLGKDAVEIVPGISSMQLAFARIKESWEDAVFLSVHARPLEDVLESVRSSGKICLFTDGRNTPDAVGRFLLDRGITDFRAFVCEELGSEKEKIFQGSLEELSRQKFSPLNVLILMSTSGARSARGGCLYGQDTAGRIQNTECRIQDSHTGPGIPDEEFHQVRFEKGLITKMEIRAVSLAKMGLREDSVVWDIGAGSGAVSIEASLVARRGKVYAIEKEGDRLDIIRQNVEKFSAWNVIPVKASAPEGLESLPEPDAVFVGGSGGKISQILDACCARVKTGGRIVVNLATIENLSLALSKLEERMLNTEIVYLSAARGSKIKDLHRLEGMNPVFVITGKRAE